MNYVAEQSWLDRISGRSQSGLKGFVWRALFTPLFLAFIVGFNLAVYMAVAIFLRLVISA